MRGTAVLPPPNQARLSCKKTPSPQAVPQIQGSSPARQGCYCSLSFRHGRGVTGGKRLRVLRAPQPSLLHEKKKTTHTAMLQDVVNKYILMILLPFQFILLYIYL